jgi:peroxiredoxin
MKKLLLAATIVGFVFTTAAGQQAKIEGHIKFNDPVKKVYLYYSKAGERMADSTNLKDNRFIFTEKVAEPSLATLVIRFDARDSVTRRPEGMQFYIEPGNIKINATDSLQNAVVSGSESQKDFEKLQLMLKPYNEKMSAFSTQYMDYRKNNDTSEMKKIEGEADALDSVMNLEVYLKYAMNNPSSPVALYAMETYAGYDIDRSKVEPLCQKLASKIRNSASGKAFYERIETAKKTAVGSMAMNFTQPDTLGHPVSLSNFKGKYLLLDFWASWCGPCRAENPNVVKAFNEYKDKNFTVLSVSLDQPGKKEAWLNAIHKDGLTWTHVSDLKFWDNAVAKEYGIRAIPQNLLLDPSGKIIAKNIRGEELNTKLEEIFK